MLIRKPVAEVFAAFVEYKRGNQACEVGAFVDLWGPGWISFFPTGEEDFPFALALFRRNYERIHDIVQTQKHNHIPQSNVSN